ncbi:MAG: TetR/AcrR family transcriptional regulator [Clostridium sp.]|uniref:TetR/AcrR family transcriptional regulator n=1 Tax=Clostridium sp. TaxID=1506 RepID=UPI0029085AAC|nr:TetR/AcrR family transcriptional regulator [Clostridium sp.]MDU7336773.1 TetR/AcrR family transcriptional regulator [Clostridium sp.]
MNADKVRIPKQTRSIQTKTKILDVAYALFCEKGYYNTTTNEIAKVANLSIGSLYSYYKDKNTIFFEILERYNQSFQVAVLELRSQASELHESPRAWVEQLIRRLIELHRSSISLNKELQILSFTIPEVSAVMKKQQYMIREIITRDLFESKHLLRVEDLEACAIVVDQFIRSIVDQIVFLESPIEEERILNAGVDAVCQYLFIQTN